MACACQSKTSAKATTYTVSLPGGAAPKTYATEVEAAAAARRGGGTYKKS